MLADATYFPTIGNLKLNPQTGFADWNQDFPNPIDFYAAVDTATRSSRPTTRTSARSTIHHQQQVTSSATWTRCRRAAEARSRPSGRRSTNTPPRRPTCAVFGYASFPKFASNRLNYGAAVLPRWSTAGTGSTFQLQVAGCRRRGAIAAPLRWPRGVGSRRRHGDGIAATNGDRDRALQRQFPRGGWASPVSHRRGWAPTSWRGGGCGATASALAFGGLFLLIVVLCLLAPGLRARTSRTPARTSTTSRKRSGSAARRGRGLADRACRSVRPGTAGSSSAPTRTVATSRCGCSTAGATRSRSAPWRR